MSGGKQPQSLRHPGARSSSSWDKMLKFSADCLYRQRALGVQVYCGQYVAARPVAELCNSLRYYTQHCTAQHCTALHCTALHCTALHSITIQGTVRHGTAPATYKTASHRCAAHRIQLKYTASQIFPSSDLKSIFEAYCKKLTYRPLIAKASVSVSSIVQQ